MSYYFSSFLRGVLQADGNTHHTLMNNNRLICRRGGALCVSFLSFSQGDYRVSFKLLTYTCWLKHLFIRARLRLLVMWWGPATLSGCSADVHIGGEERGVAATARVREAVWLAFNRGEHVPEAEGLISSPSYDALPVWTHWQVKYSIGVACQCSYFLHGWVLPYYYLIEWIAVCADYLVYIFWEH